MADPFLLKDFISDLNTLSGLIARLQSQMLPSATTVTGDMKKTADELKEIINKLEKQNLNLNNMFDELNGFANNLVKNLPTNFGEARKNFNSITGVISTQSATPASSDDEDSMDTFFTNVSQSLINAQKALNRSSLDYIAELESNFPPSYYSIPSVKAEMKVGFSKITSSGINLILFNKSNQKNEYGESTVTFEVVGAPPPPGQASYGSYVVPMPRFLLIGDERESFLDRLQMDENIKKLLSQHPTLFDNTREQVIVLRFERTGNFDSYLVIWPSKRKNASVEKWHSMIAVYVKETKRADGSIETKLPTDKNESIFEFPTPDPLVFISENEQNQSIINLGDFLMNIMKLLDGWLDAVKVKKPSDS